MSLLDSVSLCVTPNAYNVGTLYSVIPNTTLGDMDVTRNTTATRVNSAGLIESVAINVPRIDYTGGGCPSILVEPARTNSLLYSEQFDNGYWSKYQATVSSNAEAAPDGTTTADLVYPTITGPITGQVYKNITTGISSGNVVTVSTFVKASGKNFAYISAIQSSFSPAAEFNLTTGAITNISAGSTASMTAFANGWWRISVSSTAGAGLYYAVIASLDAAGSTTNIASGTNGILIWGAQLELGSNATSYIPTTTIPITRNADVISKTGISSLIGQTEGTLYAEINITTFDIGAFLTISDGTSANVIQIYTYNDNKIYCSRVSATQSASTQIPSSALIAGTYKVAFAYQSGNSYLYINGAQVGATSAETFTFGSMGKVNIGTGYADSTFFNNRIKSAILFPTRLSPGQLATLTT